MRQEMRLKEYLEKIAVGSGDDYGQQFRSFFADNKGSAELGMLVSPTADELAQLRKAVSIMTVAELASAAILTDEQVRKIASDADIDPGIFAIFINGYALQCKNTG